MCFLNLLDGLRLSARRPRTDRPGLRHVFVVMRRQLHGLGLGKREHELLHTGAAKVGSQYAGEFSSLLDETRQLATRCPGVRLEVARPCECQSAGLEVRGTYQHACTARLQHRSREEDLEVARPCECQSAGLEVRGTY